MQKTLYPYTLKQNCPAGFFHRAKRTPGKFMVRLKVPNGVLTAKQLRFLGSVRARLPAALRVLARHAVRTVLPWSCGHPAPCLRPRS
jgi:hypothetical protein